MTSWDKYAGKARGWSDREYARADAYLSHRAELIRRLGPPLLAGDHVLDLACGDGGLAAFLPDQRYLGVDASEEMVAAGRERGRELVQADLNDYEPPHRCRRRRSSARSTTHATGASSSSGSRATRSESSCST